MNLPLEDLPAACDTLVIGAGPAGSAAATLLARAGLHVVLVDQHAFPRDKTCGDGLMPDAYAALDQLGVLDKVLGQARVAQQVSLVGPRGGRLQLPAAVAVLSRRQLDDLLCRTAVQAGAHMHAPARFVAPLTDAAGTVTGARLEHRGVYRDVAAQTLVLATGAAPQALLAAGLCRRRRPSGMAMRVVVSHPAAKHGSDLEVIWHGRLRDGYGWLFPGPGGTFNIGVGWFHRGGSADGATPPRMDLRGRFQALCEVHAGVRDLMENGVSLGSFQGAPLRCTLEGADFGRPGVLVAGEAAGTTYCMTGEGIGKALESGSLAAQAILSARRDEVSAARLHEPYAQAMEALKPRFRLYEQANCVNTHPWLADLVIWRGNHSARLRQRMGRVLNETSTPGNLMSFKGARRLILG